MPILSKGTSLYPNELLDDALQALTTPSDEEDERKYWWSVYTRSRQEKQLMRKLLDLETPFCCPTIERRYRSPAGRLRCVHEPLFSNYVFIFGTTQVRYDALTTNCVSQCNKVADGFQLTDDLRQIQGLIDTGAAITPESKLAKGDRVRVRTGTFAGYEGTVLHRENEKRLLVSVRFMQKGASVLLDDCQLEPISTSDEETKGKIDAVYILPNNRRQELSLPRQPSR